MWGRFERRQCRGERVNGFREVNLMLYDTKDTILPTLKLADSVPIHIDDDDDEYLYLDIGPRHWTFCKKSGICTESGTRLAPSRT